MRIEQMITDVSTVASSIAAAVEQQGMATAEMARNIAGTAAAANEMTSRTTEASAEAGETGRQASKVHEDASGLSQAVNDLRLSVIRVVRTSTAEVDRQANRRYETNLAGRLTIDGAGYDVRVADLSQGGALVKGAPAVEAGHSGTLHIEGVETPLPFVVTGAGNGSLHLAFKLDDAEAAKFGVTLARLAQQPGAAVRASKRSTAG